MSRQFNRYVYVILYNGEIQEVWDDYLMAQNRFNEFNKRLKKNPRPWWQRILDGMASNPPPRLRLVSHEVEPKDDF